jgi:hypothetical protein
VADAMIKAIEYAPEYAPAYAQRSRRLRQSKERGSIALPISDAARGGPLTLLWHHVRWRMGGDQRPRLCRRYSPDSGNRLAPPTSLEKRNTEGCVDCILDRHEHGVNGRLHR